jgi:hypothetical protein
MPNHVVRRPLGIVRIQEKPRDSLAELRIDKGTGASRDKIEQSDLVLSVVRRGRRKLVDDRLQGVDNNLGGIGREAFKIARATLGIGIIGSNSLSNCRIRNFEVCESFPRCQIRGLHEYKKLRNGEKTSRLEKHVTEREGGD